MPKQSLGDRHVAALLAMIRTLSLRGLQAEVSKIVITRPLGRGTQDCHCEAEGRSNLASLGDSQ